MMVRLYALALIISDRGFYVICYLCFAKYIFLLDISTVSSCDISSVVKVKLICVVEVIFTVWSVTLNFT